MIYFVCLIISHLVPNLNSSGAGTLSGSDAALMWCDWNICEVERHIKSQCCDTSHQHSRNASRPIKMLGLNWLLYKCFTNPCVQLHLQHANHVATGMLFLSLYGMSSCLRSQRNWKKKRVWPPRLLFKGNGGTDRITKETLFCKRKRKKPPDGRRE